MSFLFHFNQDLVPMGAVASLAGYVGLLETLRRHPNLPVQIQISGTLLNNLTWFDKRPIDLIRAGVAAGQFELLGSTYSQNVMYASNDPWTNARQIDTHRALLKQRFDVEPTGFWNPERVWTQAFVPLLAGHGYRYTMVETHILAKTDLPAPNHLVRTTRRDGQALDVVHDDTFFKDTFDRAVDTGHADSLLHYLRTVYEADTTDAFLVAYFQDAEASGLWQYERGEDPRTTWKTLDSLLTLLEAQDWLHVTTGARFLAENATRVEQTPIADGQADWMIAFSRAMGYEDWYDYLARDPVQVHFRPLFTQVRDSLHSVDAALNATTAAPSHEAATRLFERAVRTFLAHEYEYGASWYWTIHDGDFNFVRETLVSLLAVRYALHPVTRTYQADVNLDGVEEIILVNPNDLYVFSPWGGRLLYWFDLRRGTSFVGNENFNYYTERYVDGSRYVPDLTGGKDVYPWRRNNRRFPEIFDWTFRIRRCALNDWLYAGGVLVDSLVHQPYPVTLGDGAATFTRTTDDFALRKTVTAEAGQGLRVQYALHNQGRRSRSVEFVVENGFSPSYTTIMDTGPESLGYWNGTSVAALDPETTLGVQNVITGARVSFAFEEQPFYVTGRPVVFGLELNPKYVFTLEPGAGKEIRFTLTHAYSDTPRH